MSFFPDFVPSAATWSTGFLQKKFSFLLSSPLFVGFSLFFFFIETVPLSTGRGVLFRAAHPQFRLVVGHQPRISFLSLYRVKIMNLSHFPVLFAPLQLLSDMSLRAPFPPKFSHLLSTWNSMCAVSSKIRGFPFLSE